LISLGDRIKLEMKKEECRMKKGKGSKLQRNSKGPSGAAYSGRCRSYGACSGCGTVLQICRAYGAHKGKDEWRMQNEESGLRPI